MKTKKRAPKKAHKKVVVAVSGGFDPIHVGHVRMFERARMLGDELVVILNNDNWLKKKKGFAFMPEKERKEVIEGLRAVDRVVLTKHKPNDPDTSVSHSLREVRPDIFANGGDRKKGTVPEVGVCEEIGCLALYNIGEGGKIQSSSWLLEKHFERKAAAEASRSSGKSKVLKKS
jgi:D-beta-D-heptose 7-phosphate kinase/D-beta-D-heptose 1-phosphate adenosyltransferase